MRSRWPSVTSTPARPGASVLSRKSLEREKVAPASGPSPSSARSGQAVRVRTGPSLERSSQAPCGARSSVPCSSLIAASGRRTRRGPRPPAKSHIWEPGDAGVARWRPCPRAHTQLAIELEGFCARETGAAARSLRRGRAAACRQRKRRCLRAARCANTSRRYAKKTFDTAQELGAGCYNI